MNAETPWMPDHRWRDSQYGALYTILERVHRSHPFLTERGLDKERLLAASQRWEPWERTMVKAALALFDEYCIEELGESHVQLPELMRDLDDSNLGIVLRAITVARGWRKARLAVPPR
jgi:hypothetical protein